MEQLVCHSQSNGVKFCDILYIPNPAGTLANSIQIQVMLRKGVIWSESHHYKFS